MNDIINREKYAYERTAYVSEDGKKKHSTGKNDAVARAMLGMDQDALIAVMKANEGMFEKLGKHVGNVNPGQLRMFIGNSLRARIKKGTPVQVGEHLIRKLDQHIRITEAPKAPKPAPKSAAKEKAEKTKTRRARSVQEAEERA